MVGYILLSHVLPNPIHDARVYYILKAFQKPFNSGDPQIGIFPGLSVILWSAASFICLFSFNLIKRHTKSKREYWFLLYPGLLIGIVMLDEAFRFKLMLSVYLGIPKITIYGVYTFLAILFIYSFRREIRQTPYLLLLASGTFFFISGMADSYSISGRGLPILLEDVTKIFGVTNLVLYFYHVCHHQTMRVMMALKRKNH